MAGEPDLTLGCVHLRARRSVHRHAPDRLLLKKGSTIRTARFARNTRSGRIATVGAARPRHKGPHDSVGRPAPRAPAEVHGGRPAEPATARRYQLQANASPWTGVIVVPASPSDSGDSREGSCAATLVRSSLPCAGTTALRPSSWRRKRWLPLIRITAQPPFTGASHHFLYSRA